MKTLSSIMFKAKLCTYLNVCTCAINSMIAIQEFLSVISTRVKSKRFSISVNILPPLFNIFDYEIVQYQSFCKRYDMICKNVPNFSYNSWYSSWNSHLTQHAQWILNKIENTFKWTFIEYKSIHLGFSVYFVWNPRSKAIETTS